MILITENNSGQVLTQMKQRVIASPLPAPRAHRRHHGEQRSKLRPHRESKMGKKGSLTRSRVERNRYLSRLFPRRGWHGRCVHDVRCTPVHHVTARRQASLLCQHTRPLGGKIEGRISRFLPAAEQRGRRSNLCA